MAEKRYNIHYKTIKPVEFSSKSAAKSYLESERELWRPLQEAVAEKNELRSIQTRNHTSALEGFDQVFDRLLKACENVDDFNRKTATLYQGEILPPPSSSTEGILILGLLKAGRKDDAIHAFIYFVARNYTINYQNQTFIKDAFENGKILHTAAHAAAALAPATPMSKRLNEALRSAKANAEALDEEVATAQTINKEHAQALERLRDHWKRRAKRIEAIIVRRERQRRSRYDSWLANIDDEVAKRFERAEKRLAALDRANKTKQEERQAEFDRLLDLFHTQLRSRAPAKLWSDRAAAHIKKANHSRWVFLGGTAAAVLIGIMIPYCFGDYIAQSFFTLSCDQATPPVCTRVFSAKGPLTVAGLLLVMSLVMWALRLTYKIYLSERHLALDASEKEAFAQTFLAIKEGANVDAQNEAIVLASLFRPTQDGIIKDDEGAIDFSAAAIIARQLGKGTP
ncbi:DUF6161 domain-containing protein [Futiania mangrovi]|uniref:DUF6161 domain-containing protein n=1 Tax=Futiania mangrovi TaxID=2959716 RepID=A0A9J6PLL7_9PROT|nr:DUF6161 domain-containing protein [Futiania mangrovii]MCP1337535.1 DUF6161 domain-containing protein [Futiania mangrovii]